MMTAALAIGLGCGVLAVGLNWSVHSLRLFISDLDLGWRAIFFPALGAGIAVLFVRSIMHDSAGHGVSDVIKAIRMGSEGLRRRMIFSRFFGSFLTVGSGGSTGLEGPIVSIGAALGSTLGRWLNMNERHKKLLVGYGAAGAVAGIMAGILSGWAYLLYVYPKFSIAIWGVAHEPWLGIDHLRFGMIGAPICLVTMVIVSLMTKEPDAATQKMVDDTRIPTGKAILGKQH